MLQSRVTARPDESPAAIKVKRAGSSIGVRFDETGGRTSGFDYLRVILAISIICMHCFVTSYGFAASDREFLSPARPLVRMILPAFFALSGFLVAGSLDRAKTLGMFLGLRALRIYPALMVDTVFSALILGPVMTSVPLKQYFSDPEFHHYLANMFGDVHFLLPGLFEHNPLPKFVNGQLWTIPFELYCYVVLAGLALMGVCKRPLLAPLGAVAVSLVYLAATLHRHGGHLLFVAGAINGVLLIATFLFGASVYFFRYRLPFNWRWGCACGLLGGALLCVGTVGDFFAPIPIAYFTIFAGLQDPPGKWLKNHDYSYGIYLYGFALQQAVVALIPLARQFWYINLAIDIPVVIGAAAVSWHCFEKPAQKLRKPLKRLESDYLVWRKHMAEHRKRGQGNQEMISR